MAGRKRNVISMGEFKYPDIDLAEKAAHSTKGCHFMNRMQVNFINRMVEAPTRDNILQDLLITNGTE